MLTTSLFSLIGAWINQLCSKKGGILLYCNCQKQHSLARLNSNKILLLIIIVIYSWLRQISFKKFELILLNSLNPYYFATYIQVPLMNIKISQFTPTPLVLAVSHAISPFAQAFASSGISSFMLLYN